MTLDFHFRFSVQLLAIVTALGSLTGAGSAQDTVPGSQLGRVKMASGEHGKTVVTADGKLFRGTSLMIFSYGRSIGKSDHIYDEQFWQTLVDNGVNAVRLACFDPWQRSHGAPGTAKPYPYADFREAGQRRAMLKDYDQVVDAAGRHGLYVMINYHDTGGYRDPDFVARADASSHFKYLDSTHYLTRFWQIVAPRYKDRTHVFYELMNEPVQWWPENYDDQVLSDIKKLYDQVRFDAPRTHLVLISSANHMSLNPNEGTLLSVARQLKSRGVDFANASVGVHAYNTRYPAANEAAPLLATMKEFAVINTEANLPKQFNPTPNDADGSGFDGDKFGTQSMERLGISWFHWKTHSPQEINDVWIQRVISDAKAKGYYWKK